MRLVVRPLLTLAFTWVPLLAQTSATSADSAAPTSVSAPASLGADDAKAAVQPAYATDPKFIAMMKEARLESRRGAWEFAGDAYKKADKIAGGQCVECLNDLYKMQMLGNDAKGAVATADKLQALAVTPMSKASAEIDLARAMVLQAGPKAKPAQLAAVHAVFQQALALYPKAVAALYDDGAVLARMGEMDEARKEFALCAQCVPANDPARLRAEHFAENPELSTHKMAPAFEVTSLDGKNFNLDAMGGKVVLIDFWATWCGPCNEELPQMKKIARDFAGQPLVILSVSWDSDDAKWKQFIAKNDMTWLQYRDADHKLSAEFGIHEIPHYFTIDSDGVLTAEMLGSGNDVEGRLKKLVAKAVKQQANSGMNSGAE